MAKYTIDSIRENPEFLNFAKSEYGYGSFDEIPLWEQNALFYKFKALENDLDESDFNILSSAENAEKLEEIATVYYPGQEYKDLPVEDLAFVQAMDLGLKLPGAPTLDKIREQHINDGDYNLGVAREHYTKENLDAIMNAHEIYLLSPEELQNNERLKEMSEKYEMKYTELFEETVQQATIDIAEFAKGDLTIDDNAVDSMQKYIETFGKEYQGGVYKYTPEAEAALKKLDSFRSIIKDKDSSTLDNVTKDGEFGIGVIPGGQDKPNENLQSVATEDYRIRSDNSDSNEFMMEKMQLECLLDMKVINDKIYQSGIKDPQSAIATFHSMRKLNAKEQKDLQSRMTDKMLASEQLFNETPPSFLADRYEELQAKLAEDKKNKVANPDTSKLERVETLMDQLALEINTDRALFYNDTTNIADTYDGYMKMFDAREKYLDKEKDAAKIIMLNDNRAKMTPIMNEYDSLWNIDKVQTPNAEKRLDAILKDGEQATLSDETLALVSNFKFLGKDNQPEPQFENAKGEKNDVWQKGSKIIPGSQLDTVLAISKQRVLMENIGSNDEITPQFISKELNETLPGVLFALHTGDKVIHGAMEHPEQYTDKKYLDAFVKDLGNIEKPMSISPLGFDKGIDGQVNEVAGYATRLGKKVGPENPLFTKFFKPIEKLDKRADDRFVDGAPNKKKIRLEMLKRTIKGGASAFLVSGAITVAGAAFAADAQLTAATGGMNKLAGAAIGLSLAGVMITRNIMKWRKMQKAEGKPAGLKAFVKEPRMLSTVATTALGAAALGFAISGNPGLAQICGYGALTVGVGSGIVLDTIDSKKAGLSTIESLGWGALRGLTTVGAALGGRAAANAGIDWYNQNNPDNTTFQHKEKGEPEWKVTGKETVTDYTALDDNADKFLNKNWYADHPDLLQQRIDALTAAGVENPHHLLLAAHDAGLRAPDNMNMWDGTTSQGNHMVMTQTWAEQAGVKFEDVQALKNVFNADGSVNADAISAYKNVAPHVGEDNFITRMDPRPVIRELYGDRESTYDRNANVPTKEIEKGEWVTPEKMVPNKSDLGLGMLGIFMNPVKAAKKLKDRIGSLADAIFKKQKPITPPVDITPPVVIVTPPKDIEKPITPPKHIEKPKTVNKLMLDEYKIVYGIEPNTEKGKDQQWQNYCNRVEEERKVVAPEQSINQFLLHRRSALDKAVLDAVPGNIDLNANGTPIRKDYEAKQMKDDRGHTGVVMEARENLMQSNLTKDNFINKITLSHFTKFIGHFVKHDEAVADGSRNIALNPILKDKYKKPGSKVDVIDLNQYLVEGKPLEQSTSQVSGKDARTEMATVKKNNERR